MATREDRCCSTQCWRNSFLVRNTGWNSPLMTTAKQTLHSTFPKPYLQKGSRRRPMICSDRLAAQLYFGIYNREKAKTMANIYMSPPSEWEAATHPCLSEHPVGSELWRQSHLLYGVESVPRVNFCHHPLAKDFFYLFLAADCESLLVPVIRRDPAIPNLPDQIIGRLLEPFWRYGCGKVLCSVCLADVINGEFKPVFLTRNEFLQHWVEQHLSTLVAVTTFSATSLNSRLYQGHAIYLLASNVSYSEDLRDSPHLIPTNYTGIRVKLSCPSLHAASFAASFTPDADADAEKLLDANDGTPNADAESESLLDADDETLGIDNMDTDDHQSFPTPSEAYRKQTVDSDPDAVKKARRMPRRSRCHFLYEDIS